MSVPRPAVSALTAAQRILDQHEDTKTGLCHWCRQVHPCCNHVDAGLVVARVAEAAKHLEAIRECMILKPETAQKFARDHAMAALAALTGGTE